MTNPEITTVNVTDTPVLIFSGTGKVQFNALTGPGTVRYGDASLDAGNVNTWSNVNGAGTVEFKAHAEVWAQRNVSGTGVVRIERWY